MSSRSRAACGERIGSTGNARILPGFLYAPLRLLPYLVEIQRYGGSAGLPLIPQRDGLAEKLFAGERIRQYQAFAAQAQRRLMVLNDADRLVDMRALPSNRFEALGGNRKGQYSLRINDQWRLCFRWECRRPVGEKDDILLVQGDAIDVEIVDYH